MVMPRFSVVFFWIVIAILTGCDISAINSPYPAAESEKTVSYSSFMLRPKHLDPARSYSANESLITAQIYEPPFQYHYLKRPYQMEPLTAAKMPEVEFLDKNQQVLAGSQQTAENIAFSRYTITLRPGIAYQPHPAFAQDASGQLLYHDLDEQNSNHLNTIMDFPEQATRELKAADYVYQIKRLAHPEVHSPILGLMSEHIVGLGDFAAILNKLQQQDKPLDLRELHIDGVEVIDDYQYQITVYGQYPQLKYWLAMPFFAPIPWEVDVFYQQTVLKDKNITLDWYPIGTGAYQMVENDPNRRMVMIKNPNYHGEIYPSEGNPGDAAAGLLDDAGLPMPFIDKIIYTLEKESTSYWGKFIQGYYDISGLTSDSFEQAIQVSSGGSFGLSEDMMEKGIDLQAAVGTTTHYIGFNMLDSVVGGDTEQARKLRQAIAIAIDQEEFVSIFFNGRGIPAQGPIPPGIFGYREGREGLDPYVYEWRNDAVRTKPISFARELLADAGYPNGRDAETGQPLVLYFDVSAVGPDAKAQLDWMRKQFQKLNIQLVIRSTDYNRFQDKMRRGQTQIFKVGWSADYPDPENFLFLLYGPNAKAIHNGENSANYQNPEFDELFEQMRVMPDGDERQKIIDKMVDIVRHDVPWVWGFHPKQLTLFHAWNKNIKPNLMANNTLKYHRIDPLLRDQLRSKWNQPTIWPLILLLFIFSMAMLPAVLIYRRKKYQQAVNT
ncbi:MAG: ABC transporter substrate-binding protein [Methylophaga sp.]|jgi:oligopeptide transport system substrate-binding protein|nr:ABC transporter substrate-binding protein [Methylophaga sp.]MBL1458429.1 ABC transporter substrate-binding protein [Methylophaga sp.]